MVHLAIRLRGEALLLLANQKQELTVAGMFVSDRIEMGNIYRGFIKDASYQV
jgi:hypothetical protein